MARGWESKSVEDQVADRMEAPAKAAKQEEARADQAARQRQKQLLELQRERVLSERTSSPVRRSALEAALKEIEARLLEV
jgi:hypothetical protein